MIRQTRHDMDQLIFGAGFGTAILSWTGLLAAKYYHWIIAGLTSAIIVLEAWPIDQTITVVWLGGYLLYFFARQLMDKPTKDHFYHSAMQFVRVQMGIVFVTAFILLLRPDSLQTTLWLLFVLVLQVASKHCPTWVLIFALVEVCAATLLLYMPTLDPHVLLTTSLWANVLPIWLWNTQLIFILHYLVRNIDARDETIAGYELVNTLSSRLDSLEAEERKWESVLDTCLAVVHGHVGLLWYCDSKTRQIELLAHSNASRAEQESIRPLDAVGPISFNDDNLIASVVRSRAACYCDVTKDVATFEGACNIQATCPRMFDGMHSLMLIPIIDRQGTYEQTIALLGIGFHKSSPPPSVVLKEYQLLLANMVHHIKPMYRLERHVQELHVLQHIGREVSRSLDLKQVLDSILSAIVTTLGFEFATISLVDEEQQLIRTVQGANVPEEWINAAVHHLDSDDIQADVVRSGNTEILYEWDERFDRKIWERFGHKSVIRVFSPIVSVDQSSHLEKVIGTVEAGYQEANRDTIDEQQVTALRAFMDQASVAIVKAQMFERLERRAEVLTAIHRVSQIIGVTRELPRVFDEIGESAEKVLEADVVILYRYDRQSQSLQPPLIFGTLQGKKPLTLTIKKGGILEKLIRDKQPYFASDALTDSLMIEGPHFHPADNRTDRKRRTFTQRQNIKSFAGLPLVVNGQIVGILCVNYRRRHGFAPDERLALNLFAQQAATAIRNAETRELTRDLAVREERHRLSRDLHDSLSQCLPAIGLMAENAKDVLKQDPESAKMWIGKIQQSAHLASRELDFTVSQLARVDLEGGLKNAVIDCAGQIEAYSGLQIGVDINLEEMSAITVQETIFLAVREALVNAVKHANATKACTTIYLKNDCAYFWVSDNGCGFSPEKEIAGRHGLISMRDRVQMLGGKLVIRSLPNRGTKIIGRIPLGERDNG